jgi:hypothetical protein
MYGSIFSHSATAAEKSIANGVLKTAYFFTIDGDSTGFPDTIFYLKTG